MGKYMKKAKNSPKISPMEVSEFPLGVLTRAKALALKRLQQSLSPTPGSPARSSSCLQLRNRSLKKPPVKQTLKQSSEASGSVSVGYPSGPNYQKPEEAALGVCDDSENVGNGDLGVEEASFGENILDNECRERSTRESTPCNLVRDPDTIRTSSSTTRRTISTEANSREHISSNIHIPTEQEIDDFFARAEEMQHRQFIEKYNFDPVNDTPLPGRHQWEALEI